MKRCVNCGELVDEHVNFCPYCGELLADLNQDMGRLDTDQSTNKSVDSTPTSEISNSAPTKWNQVKENVSNAIDGELILSYLAGYGQFFIRTVANPMRVFDEDYFLDGLINLVVFTILLVFASSKGFLLNLLAVLLFIIILYGITRLILNNSKPLPKVASILGAELSLSILFLLIVSLFGGHTVVGPYLWIIFGASFIVALTLYIFEMRTESFINSYYQLLFAYTLLLLTLYLLWSQGMI